MARKVESSVDITVRANDQASKKLKKVGNTVNSMPEKFGKANSAMMAFQSTSQGTGKVIGEMSQRFAELGALVAVGGPIGVGLAAITVATMAGTAAWTSYQAETVAAKNAMKSLGGVTKTLQGIIDKHTKSINDQREAMKYQGMSQKEVKKAKLEESIQIQSKTLPAYKAEIETLKNKREELAKVTRTEQTVIVGTRGQTRVVERQIQVHKERIGQIVEQIKMMEKTLPSLEESNRKKKEDLAITGKTIITNESKEKKDKAQAAWEKSIIKDKVAGLKTLASYRTKIHADKMKNLDREIAKDDELIKKNEEKAAKAKKAAAEVAEAENKAREEAMLAANEAQQRIVDVSMTMSQAMGQGIANAINNQKNAFAQTAVVAVDTAQTVIMSAAAKAAAEAGSSMAGIPVVGPILAAIAAATIFGVIRAYLTKLPTAAEGGLVSSGMKGYDTEPVLTQRGEGILKPGQTDAIIKLADSIERGGLTGARAGRMTGGISQVNNFTSVVPPTSAETSRQMIHVSKQLRRLRRRGF